MQEKLINQPTQEKKGKPDPVYESYWAAKLVNKLMYNGEKQRAEILIYNSYKKLKQLKKGRLPLAMYIEILTILKPILTLIPKRVGKNIYQIPMTLKPYNSTKIALKGFLKAVRSRHENGIQTKYINETLSIIEEKRKSPTVKMRDEFYSNVAYNRTYSHYRGI